MIFLRFLLGLVMFNKDFFFSSSLEIHLDEDLSLEDWMICLLEKSLLDI